MALAEKLVRFASWPISPTGAARIGSGLRRWNEMLFDRSGG